MPSQDKFHEEHPETNEWLTRDEDGVFHPKPGTTLASYQDSKKGLAAAKQAAQLQDLAERVGLDPEELAKRVPEDTIRRLKYPVIISTDDQGRQVFKHDPGIIQGERPLLGVDRGEHAADRRRTGDGRFSR